MRVSVNPYFAIQVDETKELSDITQAHHLFMMHHDLFLQHATASRSRGNIGNALKPGELLGAQALSQAPAMNASQTKRAVNMHNCLIRPCWASCRIHMNQFIRCLDKCSLDQWALAQMSSAFVLIYTRTFGHALPSSIFHLPNAFRAS